MTTGTTPQVEHTWKSAVFVPNVYEETRAGSSKRTFSEPDGQEVHTPPCLAQNEHEQARAGIRVGSGCQSSAKEMLRQWQDPVISIVPVLR